MATQLATGDRDRLNEVFGSFIDETIGIVARQTRDTVSFAVGYEVSPRGLTYLAATTRR